MFIFPKRFFAGQLPLTEKASLKVHVCSKNLMMIMFIKVPSRLKEVLSFAREKVDARLQEDQRKVSQSRRRSKAHETLMSEEEKKKRQKKMRKQMTQEAAGQTESEAYPTSKLTKQLSVPSSVAPTNRPTSKASKTKNAAPSTSTSPSTPKGKDSNKCNNYFLKAPPPPAAQPPEPRPQPPPAKSGERGALLNSIESFAKGKLKKAVTNDRSGPLL